MRGVHAGYGRTRVLRGIDLGIAPGEVVCLLGANGAGKTTTIRVLSGLIAPMSGSIHVAGGDMTALPPFEIVRSGIATVPEGRRVFADLTVRENLLMGAYHRRRGFQGDRELDAAFAMFPRLKERERQLGGTLSGGEQQMLAIARAIMTRPRVVLLDEPSMGLAPILIEGVLDAVRRLAREGMAVLLVEQNAVAALEVSDRGYIMERGAIVLAGPARALREDAQVQRSYLGIG